MTGEFAVDEREVPGRYGRTSGGERESTISIRYCGERLDPATLEEKVSDPYLVKEVIPGDNIENIYPFRNIRSMEPFVNTVVGIRGWCNAHHERTITSYRTVIIGTTV